MQRPNFWNRIDDAGAERRLGTDDGEVEGLLLREFGETLDVGRGDVHAAYVASDAAVARGADDLGGALGAQELPDQGVLATTTADDEDLHERHSGKMTGRS